MIHIDPDTDLLRIDDRATVEDAEPLLRELLARPGLRVDLRACAHLHAASLIVLMAVRPPLDAPPPGSGALRLLQFAGLAARDGAADPFDDPSDPALSKEPT